MESYKRMIFSIVLLLSIPMSSFCMDGIDGEVQLIPQNILNPSGCNSEPSSPRIPTPPSNNNNDDDDDSSSVYYTPRSSIRYTGLEDFDKRSCDITQDQSYAAIVAAINAPQAANTTPSNTPPASPSIVSVRNSALVGAAGATLYTLAQNSASVLSTMRRTPIDSSKGIFPILATQTAMNIVSNNAAPLFGAVMLAVLFAEMRETAQLEHENKTLTHKVKTQDDYIKRLLLTVKKHEKIEHGLIGTEHDLLVKLHKNSADLALTLAKSKVACATCKSTKNTLNHKIITPLIDAMADLEKIHNNAESLLKDEKQYSALDPRGWFQAIKDMCHKHSETAAAEEK